MTISETPTLSWFANAAEAKPTRDIQAQRGSIASPDVIPDRFEFAPVMGAADVLPGQDSSKFKVTGDFGFCPNCGASHGISPGNDASTDQAPIIDGESIPDLHSVLGEAEAEEGLSGEEEKEPSDKTERDPRTGDIQLSEEDRQEVEKLKRRYQEVRTHEQAHVAAGGQHVRGGISYEYQSGPDGKRYAVGGEVSIDTSPESDPEATIRKARTIRQAALAPAQPSSQDRKAAAAASQMEIKARQEIAESRLEGQVEDTDEVEAVEDESRSDSNEAYEVAASDFLGAQKTLVSEGTLSSLTGLPATDGFTKIRAKDEEMAGVKGNNGDAPGVHGNNSNEGHNARAAETLANPGRKDEEVPREEGKGENAATLQGKHERDPRAQVEGRRLTNLKRQADDAPDVQGRGKDVGLLYAEKQYEERSEVDAEIEDVSRVRMEWGGLAVVEGKREDLPYVQGNEGGMSDRGGRGEGLAQARGHGERRVLGKGGMHIRSREKAGGRPEISVPSVPSSAVKLDYEQSKYAGGLVDMYG
jgi:hypothetical protein